MARCLLGLGSNLGDRRAMLRRATGCVGRLSGCQLLAQSRWHETAPIGGPAGQGAFLNGALLLDCTTPAVELAGALQAIESQLGRNRAIRWDARAIDIDLLLFGDEVIDTPDLSVPHPRMSFRKFVLEPAAEIAGFMVEPVLGWTLSRLLCYLEGAPRYVAVASADAAISEWLADGLSRELGCPRLEGAGDSEVSATVEFNEWAIAQLCNSRWENDQDLAKRLAPVHKDSQEAVPPVVSAFWYDEITAGLLFQTEDTLVPTQRGKPLEKDAPMVASTLHPALVITVEPDSKENFRKKIGTKSEKKASSFFPVSPQLSFHETSERKGHGPMARIRADDPAIVLQEAVAAVRSVWPELAVLSAE